MSGWNYAELWERIADKFGDSPAQVHGDRRYSWTEFDRRADGLARFLLEDGAVLRELSGEPRDRRLHEVLDRATAPDPAAPRLPT